MKMPLEVLLEFMILFLVLLFRDPDPSKFTVFLGKSALNTTDSTEQKFNVERIVIHEHFSTDYNNDIGKMTFQISLPSC